MAASTSTCAPGSTSTDPKWRLVTGVLGQGQIGSFVVLSVANYWGYHRKELWEWLKAKSEWLLSASGVVGLSHATRPATRALSRALPRRRALCTNWKNPR